jgi:hypothetical protein
MRTPKYCTDCPPVQVITRTPAIRIINEEITKEKFVILTLCGTVIDFSESRSTQRVSIVFLVTSLCSPTRGISSSLAGHLEWRGGFQLLELFIESIPSEEEYQGFFSGGQSLIEIRPI